MKKVVNQNGFSVALVVIAVLIIALLVASTSLLQNKIEEMKYEKGDLKMMEESVTFEQLPASDSAPTEVNDDTVKELDELIKSVELESSSDTVVDLNLE